MPSLIGTYTDAQFTNLTNYSVEEERRLAPAGLRQSLEPETIVHQLRLRAGHQLVLVEELGGEGDQTLVRSVGEDDSDVSW